MQKLPRYTREPLKSNTLSLPGTWSKTGIKVCLLLSLLSAGCDSFKPVDSCDFADSEIKGYTKTNTQGQVTDEDSDDWRESPTYGLYVRVDPIFPNPVRSSNSTLRITLYDVLGGQLSNIDVIARKRDGQWVSLIPTLGRPKSIPDVGIWLLPVDLTRLSDNGTLSEISGLHRIYVVDSPLATDLCTSIISYGEVFILP